MSSRSKQLVSEGGNEKSKVHTCRSLRFRWQFTVTRPPHDHYHPSEDYGKRKWRAHAWVRALTCGKHKNTIFLKLTIWPNSVFFEPFWQNGGNDSLLTPFSRLCFHPSGPSYSKRPRDRISLYNWRCWYCAGANTRIAWFCFLYWVFSSANFKFWHDIHHHTL